MENLEKTLKDVGKLERSLYRQVLIISFIFPLIAILAQYDKFAPPFHALTELLAGTLGAAGILSAYMDSLKSPIDREEDILDFEPRFLGTGAALALVVAAILFYTFYYFARQANEICLIFLCMGIFIFFRVLTVAVLNISKVELQHKVWRALDDETRNSLRQAKKQKVEILEKLAQDLNSIDQKYAPRIKQMKDDADAEEKRRRQERILAPFLKLRRLTFPLRRRVGLASSHEIIEDEDIKFKTGEIEREVEEWFNERGKGWHDHAIPQIAEGKSTRLHLEGTALDIHEMGTWKYILLTGEINSDAVRELLTHIRSFKKDEKGKFERVAAVTDSSTVMSLEARDMLSDTGIELVKASSDIHPIPQQ